MLLAISLVVYMRDGCCINPPTFRPFLSMASSVLHCSLATHSTFERKEKHRDSGRPDLPPFDQRAYISNHGADLEVSMELYVAKLS